MSKKHRRSATSRRQRRYLIYVMGTAVTLAAAGLVILIAATTGGTEAPSGPAVAPATRPADVSQEGYVYGELDAPVTIDEYLDYQCPFCRMASEQILPVIEQQYVETGVAKVVFHPIAIIGEESVQAAAGAECAAEQGAFLTYHDALFANQGGENVGAFSDARLKEIAAAAGLDADAFGSCLDAGTYSSTVGDNTRAAADMGVRGTPTFLVNGSRVETSVDAISEAIELAAAD